jgi:Cft2 family RNA processing exonuclease
LRQHFRGQAAEGRTIAKTARGNEASGTGHQYGMPTLTFHGSARTVTGSKYLLEVAGHRILIDCGLFQGLKDLRLRNWSPLPVPPETIECVVLTHAHIDHSGWLPRLVSQGFAGRWTAGTADCTAVLRRRTRRKRCQVRRNGMPFTKPDAATRRPQ